MSAAEGVIPVLAEIPDALPARSRARATVLRPTPRRPRTATRSGAAARSAIAVTRASAEPAANRASSSTKIWCPCPVMSCLFDPIGPIARPALPPPVRGRRRGWIICRTGSRLPGFSSLRSRGPHRRRRPIGSHRMVAPASPRCEPPSICYQPKATVGYQSGPGAATSEVHGPPWTNACATRGRDASRRTGGGGLDTGPEAGPGTRKAMAQHPNSATSRPRVSARGVPPYRAPSARPGSGCGRNWASRSGLPRRGPRLRSRWTPAHGSAVGRRWCSRSAAAAAHRRWRWRRTSPIST